ncbi:ABC transporter ATP-binding protein [Paenibacillus elgii]|uniref:ElgT1 n=1 Tax=Paenibacillus elgii B69 TaxID=1007103 RepID=I1YCU6_9BACL|nr:ABC transporter ATP-binding protein [Paenibacillus elgii]AFI99855.1 ElgT1 [Paenibacillus elgii B69]
MSNISTIKKFLSLVYSHYRNSKLGFAGLILLSISIPVLQNTHLYVTEKIGNSLLSEGLSTIIILLLVQSIVFITSQVLLMVNKLIENKLTPQILFSLEQTLINKLARLKMISLEDSHTYNKLITVRRVIPQLGMPLISSIFSFFQSLLMVSGMIYILRNLHWSIICILISFSVLNFFVTRMFNKLQLSIFDKTSETIRMKEYVSQLFYNRALAGELKIFNLHHFFSGKWSNLFWGVEEPNISLSNKRTYLIYSIQMGINLVQLAMLLILIITSYPVISVGSFLLVSQAIVQFQGRANEIINSFAHIHQSLVYIPTYFELINLPEEKPASRTNEFNGLKHQISITNLSFKYKNSNEKSVLSNINFSIKKGEKIAIVGHNGSGKTTLLKCLMGLYDNFEGEINYDGISINQLDIQTFRKKVGVIFQSFGKYPLSFEENIILSDISKPHDRNNINNILTECKIFELSKNLRYGHNTILSPEFMNGTDLSGGEWQKIALARMYYKDADVIFLDEPTSAIDPISENEIFEKFFSFSKDKTSIVLTHRLGICRKVDKIIVMENGTIKEMGDHESLMNNDGLYRKIYESQMHWYGDEKQLAPA